MIFKFAFPRIALNKFIKQAEKLWNHPDDINNHILMVRDGAQLTLETAEYLNSISMLLHVFAISLAAITPTLLAMSEDRYTQEVVLRALIEHGPNLYENIVNNYNQGCAPRHYYQYRSASFWSPDGFRHTLHPPTRVFERGLNRTSIVGYTPGLFADLNGNVKLYYHRQFWMEFGEPGSPGKLVMFDDYISPRRSRGPLMDRPAVNDLPYVADEIRIDERGRAVLQ